MAKQQKRTSEERKARVERAWQMAVDGQSQATIASELGVSQGQVSRLLARAGRRVAEQMAGEMVDRLRQSLDQTDLLWWEAMQGHKRAMQPSKRTVTKGEVVTVYVVYRDGDPAWIHEALEVMKLRFDLFRRILPRPEGAKGGPWAAERPVTVASALLEAERLDAAYRARDLSEIRTPLDHSPLGSD